ncbi:MAG: hypothetical protein EGP82_10195 [Odoribacter splanchnicus]|nr:hypothetical protein [Odoribacter splanchnicus]
MVSARNQEITKRFAEAFSYIFENNKWGAKDAFFQKYNISAPNVYRAMREPESWKVDPAVIAALCVEFGISAEWLLTGKGLMLTKHKTDQHSNQHKT